MHRSAAQLRADVQAIWRAGVVAVQPARLVPEYLATDGHTLYLGDREYPLDAIERIVVVGAGKAAGAMAVAVENTLGDVILKSKRVTGWVNVPADCVQATRAIRLHAARPPAVNEPTLEGVEGSREILKLVSGLNPRDLCICLISGGGSALLVAPRAGVSLDLKLQITREIIARGGDIRQLNLVRRALSDVKGGGLARACRAGQLATLILSDVLGDDLETIASGPTALSSSDPAAALQVLVDLDLLKTPFGKQTAAYLKTASSQDTGDCPTCSICNVVIGNNATAVDGAGIEAERRGYSHAMIAATQPEGRAETVGRWLASTAESMRRTAGPDCLISGGEPTVELVPVAARGRGGRNQQLALAALEALEDWTDLALLVGGTDGEDGPTDAAGAFVAPEIVALAQRKGLQPQEFLARNDAYEFFAQAGGLFKTGPTGTNVCDLRVLCVGRQGR